MDAVLANDSMTRKEKEQQLEIDELRSTSWSIRVGMENAGQKRWGFPFVRYTYASQARWDEYVSLIYEHIQEYLEHEDEGDHFLKERLSCPIIEDPDRLNGATWKEAWEVYDEWVMRDMEANPLGPARFYQPTTTAEEKKKQDIKRSPYWMIFIYADETSMASVLDTATKPERRLTSQGDYWTTIVASALFGSRSCREDENGVMVEDYLGSIEDECPNLYIRVKIMNLMQVYASVVGDGYYAFDRQVPGDDGICHEIF